MDFLFSSGNDVNLVCDDVEEGGRFVNYGGDYLLLSCYYYTIAGVVVKEVVVLVLSILSITQRPPV